MAEADLLLTKTRGALTHPNVRFFNLLSRIETYFEEYVNSTTVYKNIIDKLIEDNVKMTFPCSAHANTIIPEVIHYYITLRMLQTAKLQNREAKKESAEAKKTAKFKSV